MEATNEEINRNQNYGIKFKTTVSLMMLYECRKDAWKKRKKVQTAVAV